MHPIHGSMTRRSFLRLPAMLPIAAFGAFRSDEHRFQYDHVIGTSLDLVVWTSDAVAANRAETAVLEEIDRLSAILNTRDPASDISRLGESDGPGGCRELADVLRLYDHWIARTGGVVSLRPRGPNTPRNVDALGKAYIIDRAATVASVAAPSLDGLLLNIGGDIVVRGAARDIAVADPGAPHDNAIPLTRLRLHDAGIATSGTYARGAHLLDARTGRPAAFASSATVVARDAVTANALATLLCLTDAAAGFQAVGRTAGAEALRVGRDGRVRRSAGFARLEHARLSGVVAPANWPAGYVLDVTLILKEGTTPRGGWGGFGGRRDGRALRPYVAVWIETTSGKLVRILAFWANKAKYFSELSTFWNVASRDQNLLYSTSRATRDPGRYQLAWDGLDIDRKPVAPGTYRVVVETNQEHGVYAKQAGTIVCENSPASLVLSATANFEPVTIRYGPKPTPA